MSPPRGDISTFFLRSEQGLGAPGMIGRRLGGGALFQSRVQVFRENHLGLFCLLTLAPHVSAGVINRVFQGFAFVQDSDLSLHIKTDRHGRVTQGIRGTFGLNLIDHVFKLNG